MTVRSKSVFVAPVLAVLMLGALTACSPSTTSTGGGAAAGGGGSSGSTNVCTMVSASTASSAMGVTFTGSKSSSLGAGEDGCTYASSGSPAALIVTVYQSSSGMTWTTMQGVLSSLGAVKSVSGVGDKATLGGSQLNVQAGTRIIAIEGASVGTNPSGAESLAKKLVTALG
jgi:hypothetical protein